MEQVIIHAVGLDTIIHNTSAGKIEFCPVFHREFLLEVQKLQDQIEKIGLAEGKGLNNICYVPLASPFTGPTLVRQCFVQSIWGYYSEIETFRNNDTDYANFTVNYLDHFMKCAQNPYNPLCLAPFGGPVDPATALGGFLMPGEALSKMHPMKRQQQ